MSDVTLSSAMRSNLLSLQATNSLVDRTNTRLSTGLKVSTAADNAVAYFQSKGLTDRATNLTTFKDGISQGISSLNAAIGGLSSIQSILTQMKGIVLSAESASDSNRAALGTQLNTLGQQLNALANDSSYQGLNLVNATASTLTVQFSEKTAAVLVINGVDSRISSGEIITQFTANGASNLAGISGIVSGLGGVSAASIYAFSNVSVNVSIFAGYAAAFDSGIANVESNTATLGASVALLQTRSDFTTSYINTLTTGGNELVLADLNAEGANLVTLQTRQQLGIQALSFTNRSEQGVLSLFR